MELSASIRSLENDDGYYAVHLYVEIPVTIIQPDWTQVQINVKVEIQLATRLQQVLRELSHKVYAERRLEANPDKKSWKWDFSSPQFMAGYLGHSLHLIEGLLINLRDRMRSEDGEPQIEPEVEPEAPGEGDDR